MPGSNRRRIGVLLGGDSPERAVSIESGQAVLAVLSEAGHDAVPLFVDSDLDLGLRQTRIDVAFIALHGRGSDGVVQGLLESLGIPYTGSPLAAAAFAADKVKTKELVRLHNLDTPPHYCHMQGAGRALEQHGNFGYPCVVKPRSGGSGLGVAYVRGPEELEAAIETALRFGRDVLVERFVSGPEVQVAILDGAVLGAAEVLCNGICTYVARRTTGRTRVTIPPRIGAERLTGVLTQALRAYQLLDCEGLARVDFLVPESGNETLIEVNAFPDLGAHSVVAKLADAAGLGFGQLVERMLEGAHGGRGRGIREPRPLESPWLPGARRALLTSERH